MKIRYVILTSFFGLLLGSSAFGQIKLDVEGSARFTKGIRIGQAVNDPIQGQGTHIGWNRISGSGRALIASQKGQGNGGFEFITYDINNEIDNIAMTILGNGDVGIGTDTPEYPLHIVGGTDVNLSSGGYLQLGSSNALNIGIDNNEIQARNNGLTSSLTFNFEGGRVTLGGPTNDKRIRLNEDGNVGIGTTSPMAKLHINQESDFVNNATIQTARIQSVDMAIDFQNEFFSTPVFGGVIESQRFRMLPKVVSNEIMGNKIFFIGSSDDPFYGTYSTFFYAGSSSNYQTYSDRRLKSNIKPIENALETVQRLKGRIYDKDMNAILSTPHQSEQHVYKDEPGFIAQDLEKVIPQLVSTDEDSQYKTIGMMGIIPYLVEAMKELKTEKDEELAQKEAEIEALNDRLSKVEALLEQVLNKPQQTLSTQVTSLTDAKLYPNQPNPFSEQTLIRYYIPQGSTKSELQITSLEGKVIKVIPIQASGEGQLTVNAQSLSAGTYLYSLLVDGELIATEKMILTGKN